MNLLVTGGAGFIGSNVVRRFIDKKEVSKLVNVDCLTYAGHLSNLRDVENHPKYCHEPVDVRNQDALRTVFHRHSITHVVHLAAESHVDHSISRPSDFVTTNILGTYNLLEVCREFWLGQKERTSGKTTHRFHHVSTDEVYGSLGATGLFTEASSYAPNSPYSASKASGDMLVRAWHHTYGLDTVISNCSNNYGPYQFPEKLIPVAILKLLARHPVPVYGNGSNVRDWLFVYDHCDALWEVLIRGRSGEVYNIGGNNEWTNVALVHRLCDLFDEIRPELGMDSRRLVKFVPDRPGHDQRYAIDASKINRELGWRPAYTFDQGLRETLAWYLQNGEWVRTVVDEAKQRF